MVIHLISSPRNVSTALMYAFAQRTDTKVMDEPFYAYYLSQHEVAHPGKSEIIDQMECDFEQVVGQIVQLQSNHAHVFVKNMAHHLINTPIEFLKDYRNILFIRDPKEIITSFSKVISNPTMQDIGVQQQSILYQELKNLCTHAPIIIDSSELIKNPEILLTKLCNQLGIPFSKSMLHWAKGGIPEDGIWAKYWYGNVHSSTGFVTSSRLEEPFPSQCQPLLDEALPYYQSLRKNTLTA